METKKRKWQSPVSDVQRFVPQEFCAACQSDGLYYHKAKCCDSSQAGYVFWSTDMVLTSAEGPIEKGNNPYIHGGCGNYHEWSDNSETVAFNAVVIRKDVASKYLDITTNYWGTVLSAKLKSEWEGQSFQGLEGVNFAFCREPQDGHTWWIVNYDPSSIKNAPS